MRVVSVNVGLPREVHWKGKRATTAIFKEPVAGRVVVRTLNLDGDRQADLSVHGGPSKALYLYPVEHYAYWRRELPEMTLPWGMFGENLTTEGLLEDAANIGDRFRVGSAEVLVTEPRLPCFKLGIRFGRNDIIKRFLASGRTGFYAAVLKEGDVAAGDAIERLGRDPNNVAVPDITRLYVSEKGNRELLRRALRVEALPEGWREYFREELAKVGRSPEAEATAGPGTSPCCT
ncbi:MAG: MOSC domain-containing protein [candidate division NC10 bacterium]|nr:MOSC domain-containing protein [candidate division NC10 bacterium]